MLGRKRLADFTTSVSEIGDPEDISKSYVSKKRALNDLKRSLMHDLLTRKGRTDRLKLDEVAA